MAHIVLISCSSTKASERASAEKLYQGTLFKLSLRYARTLDPDEILILSAKHGLLRLDEEVEPYNETLNEMRAVERRRWADSVIRELEELADLDNDRITFLAGRRYRENLTSRIRNYDVPMEGLPIGKQLKWLKEQLD